MGNPTIGSIKPVAVPAVSAGTSSAIRDTKNLGTSAPGPAVDAAVVSLPQTGSTKLPEGNASETVKSITDRITSADLLAAHGSLSAERVFALLNDDE